MYNIECTAPINNCSNFSLIARHPLIVSPGSSDCTALAAYWPQCIPDGGQMSGVKAAVMGGCVCFRIIS